MIVNIDIDIRFLFIYLFLYVRFLEIWKGMNYFELYYEKLR